LIYASLFLGITFAVFGLFLIKLLIAAFGVEGVLLDECMVYARILLPAVPMLMLQVMFQQFMSTAARPQFGLIITVTAGVINFVLDALFIIVWQWGLAGAAWATATSQIIGAVVPLLYFIFPNKSLLHLGKTRLYFSALLKSASNGISEFVSSISMSVVCMLYNYQLLRIIGQDGVVAYGIISYVNFIFWAAFIGYTMGSNPIVSFHFGAENKKELQSLWRKSLFLITVSGVFLTLIAELFAIPIAAVFIGYDDELTEMTAVGFRIYAISFLFAGFNIYASGFFTALNNGLISATIALFRTLIFECLCVLILPIFFGLNGIWCAIIVAEILAFAVSLGFFFKYKKHYGY
jgi:Na+-driven multidrug efflux pump